jgi:hypothetical protein
MFHHWCENFPTSNDRNRKQFNPALDRTWDPPIIPRTSPNLIVFRLEESHGPFRIHYRILRNRNVIDLGSVEANVYTATTVHAPS